MRGRAAVLVGLLAIVVAGFVVRVRGIDHELPHWTYSDGFVLLDQTAYLRGESQPERPELALGAYPYLLACVAAALPDIELGSAPDGLRQALARAAEPWVRIRLASVLMSLFAIVGAYGIARRFLGPGASLLAAALTATSLLHVTYATAQRPHGAASGTAAVAVLACLHLRRNGDWKSQLLAALGVAAAIATLQSGAAALGSWLVAWHFRRQRGSWRANLATWAASLALLALAVRLAYAFLFNGQAGPPLVMADEPGVVTFVNHDLRWSRVTGLGFLVFADAFARFDPLLSAGLVLAAMLFVFERVRRTSAPDPERRRDFWVCLGFVGPFTLVFGMYAWTLDRFAMPLVPFAAVATAWVAQRAWRLIAQRVKPVQAGFAASAAMLAFPAANCWKLGTLREAPDTMERAAEWLEAHADPARARILLLLENIDLPLFYAQSSLDRLPPDVNETLYWTHFQRAMRGAGFSEPRFAVERQRRYYLSRDEEVPVDGASAIEASSFDYVVALSAERSFHDPSIATLLRKWRAAGASVQEFSWLEESETALREYSDRPALTYQLGRYGAIEETSAWIVADAQCLGPKLEIFEPARARSLEQR